MVEGIPSAPRDSQMVLPSGMLRAGSLVLRNLGQPRFKLDIDTGGVLQALVTFTLGWCQEL